MYQEYAKFSVNPAPCNTHQHPRRSVLCIPHPQFIERHKEIESTFTPTIPHPATGWEPLKLFLNFFTPLIVQSWLYQKESTKLLYPDFFFFHGNLELDSKRTFSPAGYLNGDGSLVAKSCQNSCNAMDHSPPGSSVHGILQARILEWVAISFSGGTSQARDQTLHCSPALQTDYLPTELPGKPLLK